MSPTEPERPEQPGRLLRGLTGIVAAVFTLAIGHLVAGLLNPATSPLLVVGSTMIDLAPTPAKEFVVREFGNYDKPLLIGLIGVVLLALAGGIGQLAWSRRRLALAAIGGLGLVSIVMSVFRPGATVLDVIPSVVATAAGLLALLLLTRLFARSPGGESAASAVAAERGRERRQLLLGVGGIGALAVLGGVGGEALARTRVGGSAGVNRALPKPISGAAAIPSGAQVAGNTPFVTSVADFYRVDISLITPKISADTWTLTIDGMVDRPLKLSYDELLQLPMIERTITMTCVSNEVGGRYVSTATWLGVPFSEIIKRVGVQPGVEQAYSYSLDSGYTCSTPIGALTDGRDAMIVVGMNGEVLPDKNGFPARMLVPGLFGFVSATKWLSRIEFTTYAQRSAYWTDRKWATDAPILTQSRIDVPASLSTLPKGQAKLAGVAWAQHRGIDKVEIKIDDEDWKDAELATDAGVDLWRQWSFTYDGPAGLHSATVRATDKTGKVQPEERTKVFPDGARGWHQIQFTTQ